MNRFAVIVALAGALSAASCSQSAQTGGITNMDPPATRACASLSQVLQERAAGSLSALDLRSRVGTIYNDAQTSSNPLIRARAVALYADATVMVTGGEAGRLDADLAALNQVCTGQGTGSGA
jgi:hypothetical protein